MGDFVGGCWATALAGLTNFGNVNLRSALYMPTLTAAREDRWLKLFYERLVSYGESPKLALMASMRKLVTAIYSVAKNKKPFVPILGEVTA